MELERMFRNLELTKGEFHKLKRDAVKAQYDAGEDFSLSPRVYDFSREADQEIKVDESSFSKTYNIHKVIELFHGTDIREEVVSNEIKNIIQARKNRKRNLLGAAAIAMSLSLQYPSSSCLNPTENQIVPYEIGIDYGRDGIVKETSYRN